MKIQEWKNAGLIFLIACTLALTATAVNAQAQPETAIEIPQIQAEAEPAAPPAPVIEVPEVDFTEPEIPSVIEEPAPAPEDAKVPEYAEPALPSEEDLSHFQRYLLKQMPLTVSRRVNHFGYNFFRRPPSTFAPTETLPVTAGYVIGPGDEIRINAWGMLDAMWNVTVDRNGSINIPTIGPISVAGLAYEELEPFIRRELSKQYKEFHLNVNMGRLRTIPVYLVGNVRAPGKYTVSSLSTLVNALFVSGGPSISGTMRDIRLQRGGKTVTSFDMYDFLLKGDKTKDIRLEPEDIIFVPSTGPSAAVLGSVISPAIYELRGTTSVADMISMAGGVSATAYKKKVQVERVHENRAKIILDIDLGQLSKAGGMKLQDGDIVAVYPAADTVINAVTLYGNVVRPGQYQWKEGMRVSDIIESEESLRPETKLEYALIERLQPPSLRRELLFFNLGRAVLDRDPDEDKLLQPYDTVIIYSKWQFREQFRVRIDSGVNRPGSYIYRDNMRISDLVKLAGGLKREEHPDSYLPEGMVIRRMPPDYRQEKVPFDLRKAVFLQESGADLLLHPEDAVKIFDDWDIARNRVVRVSGAVSRPGEYRWMNSMTVKDLINIAGGLEDFAYKLEAEITKVAPADDGPETTYRYVNLRKVLDEDPEHNILLDYNDYMFVRPIPEWRLYETVRVNGEVRFPGTYTIKKGTTMTALLDRSGGFTDNAYIRGAILTRESVRKSQREQMDKMIDQIEMALLSPSPLPAEAGEEELRLQERDLARKRELVAKLKSIEPDGRIIISLADAFDRSIHDMELKDGDTLVIPENPDIVTVLGAVYNQASFVYDGKLDHSAYIRKAGGFTPTAQAREIYIIKIDGSVLKPGRSYRLESGDTIVVPEKLEMVSVRREIRHMIETLYRIAVTVAVTRTIF